MSGAGFILNEKGELYGAVETSYGTLPAASGLTVTAALNLSAFKTKIVTDTVSVEDEGGGMVPGVVGQELLKVGEHVEYEGSMPMREFAVPATDTGARPDYDILLRSGGFLEGVYDLAARTVTYDVALAGNGESFAYQYREWVVDGSRKIHNIQGGRHTLKIAFKAGDGVKMELSGGMALTYASPANPAAVDRSPVTALNSGTSVMVWTGATATLVAIGGATYAGAIQEVNISTEQRVEMLPGPDATGFCAAFANPIKYTLDILLYETATGLELRDAMNDGEKFYLDLAVAGPAAAGNTLSIPLYFMIEGIAEETGPGGTKNVRLTCKLLYRDDAANTDVGIDPSEPPLQITLKTV